MTTCEDYVIRVPHKKKLHLKWCLLDEGTKDLSKVLPETKKGSQLDNGLLLDQLRGLDKARKAGES